MTPSRGAATPPHILGHVKQWLVSLALPIEAETPEGAVRDFWRYLSDLGPAELPTYVWPPDDELSMMAFVEDGPAPLDPEDD
jgi:hypothetical protein